MLSERVVEIKIVAQAFTAFWNIPIAFQINFFLFYISPEPLDKDISKARPFPSMLILICFDFRMLVNASLVYWRP